MTSVTVDADQVGWPSRDGRAGRFGLLFAGVWLVFLVDPLRAAWRLAGDEDTALAGWVGLVATVAFAASTSRCSRGSAAAVAGCSCGCPPARRGRCSPGSAR